MAQHLNMVVTVSVATKLQGVVPIGTHVLPLLVVVIVIDRLARPSMPPASAHCRHWYVALATRVSSTSLSLSSSVRDMKERHEYGH